MINLIQSNPFIRSMKSIDTGDEETKRKGKFDSRKENQKNSS